ncbi:MAG: excinuclease ABC subunit A [Candidatus Aminicenantes bacterium 4484_214]|nr:MAG: excinuclease ABC subunit A [Candidatus Aminicenantes bacterium 4484_214]
MLEYITVKKAAQHNLKHIDVVIPRNRLVVITGPSGSGKSSLAFDTLFAEGQRRYIECLSTYARQYVEQFEKPEVEIVEGISPAISIDQKTISPNPRSTVGTITEIYDFLRLLFARVGKPFCPSCGREIQPQTPEEMVERLLSGLSSQKIKILAPVVKGRKGEYARLFERWRKKGYLRVRVDGEWRELEEDIYLSRTRKHTIEVLIDEFVPSAASYQRVKEAVERAVALSEGDMVVIQPDGQEHFFSVHYICPFCELSLPELEPRTFSFNSPYGACPDCHGLGYVSEIDWRGEVHLTEEVCPTCGGERLRRESLAVKVGRWNIIELSLMPVSRLIQVMKELEFAGTSKVIASRIINEILSRAQVIQDLGMGYLDLMRPAATLSGGEARRIRLAAQVGARLRGVLYVLDEPTIGLHQRDNERLIRLLKFLRDEGNSVIVVEHDEQTIKAADYIVDLGPGAGEKGGQVVARGGLPEILRAEHSLTAQYLLNLKKIDVPSRRRQPKGWLTIIGASEHNLKEIDVAIPLGVMTGITGVSGSGKSTLVYDILYKALLNKLTSARKKPGKHRDILGVEQIDKVVSVDQKPIGRTPRSNPATYTGIFTPLRQLFALTPEARRRGYSPSRFSFNLPGGRCEECQGSGVKKIEMHFLPDVYVTCDRCRGSRYNKETLAVEYKGKNITQFLELTAQEAYGLVEAHPVLKRKLGLLIQVGLGYLRLGQPAPTLSGGEAQRIKLTRELSRKNTGRTLYLLDEPTTGLHFDDVKKLLEVLNALVDLGNTVVIIEHHPDVIKSCDYLIDLGPEGGEAGGYIVAQGTPEEVAQVADSPTGQLLRKILFHPGRNEFRPQKEDI